MNIKKIALLTDASLHSLPHIEFISSCRRHGIEVEAFTSSDEILVFKPDFIIVTTPEHAKLTPFPTYGFIGRPREEYLSVPRYLRNILTYDGYLTPSPSLRQMLEDIMFGSRKLNTAIVDFNFYPYDYYIADELHDHINILIPEYSELQFKSSIRTIKRVLPQAKTISFKIENFDTSQIHQTLKDGISICLLSGDEELDMVYPEVYHLLAKSGAVIFHKVKNLEVFGDNLNYVSAYATVKQLGKEVKTCVNAILQNKTSILQKTAQAKKTAREKYSFNAALNKLCEFHESSLTKRGYLACSDKHREQLPSVSYIMRTGGKHRPHIERALNCLIAQNYPDLRVIFVIHARFEYLDELIAAYPSLKIKVIENIKSRRSEAIRDGIAAVETDLFGLFDDDDELFPNHVYSLVSALSYHHKRDWRGEIGVVYSASIHADDTFPVAERPEYHDHKLKPGLEKRAIEHFRLYSSTLMSRHAWFMPNGWLARRSLIDDELLTDPQIDTCEDLYFELQLAQKTHFAFSMEVTAIHHFHHLGNSTIDDSKKHVPDTQRIALRNLGRVFPPDAQYDSHYNLIGQEYNLQRDMPAYQDFTGAIRVHEYFYSHAFFPLRPETLARNYSDTGKINKMKRHISQLPSLPYKVVKYGIRFIFIPREQKQFYFKKFKSKWQQHGLLPAIYLSMFKMQNIGVQERAHNASSASGPSGIRPKISRYDRFRLVAKYKGLKPAFKSLFNSVTDV